MRVIFTGDPAELEREEGLSRLSTSIYGKHFPMSAEVDVSDLPEWQRRKLMHNHHFRVAGVDAPATPLILPTSALAPAEQEAPVEAEAPAPARKRAGGRA